MFHISGLTKYKYIRLRKGLIDFHFTCQRCTMLSHLPRLESTRLSTAMDITEEDIDPRDISDISTDETPSMAATVDDSISEVSADNSMTTEIPTTTTNETPSQTTIAAPDDDSMISEVSADDSMTPSQTTMETTSFHIADSIRQPSVFDESSIVHDNPDVSTTTDDSPTTYDIVVGGTAKGKDMLLDSHGYAYNVKVTRDNSRTWWCSVRNKRARCPATVLEKRGGFVRGTHDHIHPADPGRKHTVKMSRKVSIVISNRYHAINNVIQ